MSRLNYERDTTMKQTIIFEKLDQELNDTLSQHFYASMTCFGVVDSV